MKATLDEGHELMANMDYPYPTDTPVLLSAEVGTLADDIIVLTFDQILNDTTLPAITCFTVTGAYLNAQVAAVAIVGTEVRLTLDNDARCDDTITLDYTVPPADGIRNLNDTYAESFTGEAVTNNVTILYSNEPIVYGDLSAYLSVLADVDLRLKNPVEIEFWYYFAGTHPWGSSLFEVQNNASNFFKSGININSTQLFLEMKILAVYTGLTYPNFFNAGADFYKIKIVWNGTSLNLYRNDILVNNYVAGNLNNISQAGANFRLMNVVAGGTPIPPGHSLFQFRYKTNGALVAHYPVCEESGNIAYNVVSNAHHLTGQVGYNALTWQRDNNSEKYLRDYGYRLSGAVYIPGLLSGASAADGNPLTEWSPCTEFN